MGEKKKRITKLPVSSNPPFSVKISIGTGDQMVELRDGDILRITVEQTDPVLTQKSKDVLKRASLKNFYPLARYEEYRIYKQGSQWCAVCKDFVDFDKSIVGFGGSPQQALAILLNKIYAH